MKKLITVLKKRKREDLAQKVEAVLERYQTKEYRNYKHGDPQRAAKNLENLLKDVSKKVTKALKDAGSFLAPAVMRDFRRDLLETLSKVPMPKTLSLDELLEQKGITKEEFEEIRKQATRKREEL